MCAMRGVIEHFSGEYFTFVSAHTLTSCSVINFLSSTIKYGLARVNYCLFIHASKTDIFYHQTVIADPGKSKIPFQLRRTKNLLLLPSRYHIILSTDKCLHCSRTHHTLCRVMSVLHSEQDGHRRFSSVNQNQILTH